MSESPNRTVYFEHRRVGGFVRTSAISAATGIEVVIMGPAGAAPRDLEQLALRKLERRLAQGDAQDPGTGEGGDH